MIALIVILALGQAPQAAGPDISTKIPRVLIEAKDRLKALNPFMGIFDRTILAEDYAVAADVQRDPRLRKSLELMDRPSTRHLAEAIRSGRIKVNWVPRWALGLTMGGYVSRWDHEIYMPRGRNPGTRTLILAHEAVHANELTTKTFRGNMPSEVNAFTTEARFAREAGIGRSHFSYDKIAAWSPERMAREIEWKWPSLYANVGTLGPRAATVLPLVRNIRAYAMPSVASMLILPAVLNPSRPNVAQAAAVGAMAGILLPTGRTLRDAVYRPLAFRGPIGWAGIAALEVAQVGALWEGTQRLKPHIEDMLEPDRKPDTGRP